MAHNLYFLGLQIIDSLFNALNLFLICLFFSFSVEPYQSFKDFICSKVYAFFFNLFLQTLNMFFNFSIVFLHRLVKASHWLGHFLLKITKKSFNNSDHLAFCFSDPFLELLLLFDFDSLMFLHVTHVIIEILDIFFEKAIQVSNYFMNTMLREFYTFRTDHRFAKIYALQYGFWCK